MADKKRKHLDTTQMSLMLEKMYMIRAFEEKAEELYTLGKIHGTMHLSIGMEASAVGAVFTLKADDLILSTHRGHGHCIAKNADMNLMMAEFMGKQCGYCHGRGGSMHIADVDGGNLGANGVVAGGLPVAVGVGLGLKMEKRNRVHICFFGDGATNEGAFHEALNMAAIYNLPVVFVCENNGYGMSMPIKKASKIAKISDRAAAYGMPGETVDGNDVVAVYEAVGEAVDRARAGQGPSLVENVTYRWRGHSKSDANRYRTKDEIEEWKKKDPILRLANLMTAEGRLTPMQVDDIKAKAYKVVGDAAIYAEGCDDPTLESIEEGVYAE